MITVADSRLPVAAELPSTGKRQPATFEFDGVVRLTKIGVSFVIFTIFVGFAAINTGNNALYIGLSFMLGCLLLSGVASKNGLQRLQVEFERVEEAWAGRPADGTLRVRNRSTIWNVRDVVVASPELARPIFIPLIGRRSEVRAGAAFLFAKRGIVQLKIIDLYTRYPFGFFSKKRRAKISGEVVVFPRLLDEETPRERFRPVDGDMHPSNRAGLGTDIHSFREYVRGDSYRHIYWKKSASLGRWIMKQTEMEAARAVQVVVDPYKPRGASEDDFERMVSEAATFVFDALRRGLDVMLSLPRAQFRAKPGEPAAAMYRALALLEPLYEPVAQPVDRNALVFTVRRADERASA
jgi:uncharacterized protein (DUF58 family)